MGDKVIDSTESRTNSLSNRNVSVGGTVISKDKCFVAGVVVWAKINGFPFWPAVIRAHSHIEPALNDKDRINLPPPQPNTRLVEFFLDDNNLAVVDLANLDLFTSGDYHLNQVGIHLRMIISDACTEAKTFIQACGLPFQRNATFKGNRRARTDLQVFTTNETNHSNVDLSSEEDLDIPLAALHIGKKAAPGARKLTRKAHIGKAVSSEAQILARSPALSRLKSHANSGITGNTGNKYSRLPVPSRRYLRFSNDSSGSSHRTKTVDVTKTRLNGQPPWTTKLSVLANSNQQLDTAQTVLEEAKNSPITCEARSILMKLRLCEAGTPKDIGKSYRNTLTAKRAITDPVLNSGKSKRSRRSATADEGGIDDEKLKLVSDDPMCQEALNSQENYSPIGAIKKPKNREDEGKFEGHLNDIEQGDLLKEFVKRFSGLVIESEALLEEIRKLQAKKKGFEASLEQEEGHLRGDRDAEEAQSKALDCSNVSLDEIRDKEKKAATNSMNQMASVEYYKTINKGVRHLEQKTVYEVKSQRQLEKSHRAEMAKLQEKNLKLGRIVKELSKEVVAFRDQQEGLPMSMGSAQPVAVRNPRIVKLPSISRLQQTIPVENESVQNNEMIGSSERESGN